MNINLSEVRVGDIFSEASHYSVKEVKEGEILFHHLESGKEVTLSNSYIKSILNTCDQYEKEEEVTLEDRKDGTPGIRTIFENIGSATVFTVVFKKQAKAKTKKAIAEEKEAVINTAQELINRARRQKKSMAAAYIEALKYVQDNPVSEETPGEERVLRGYKIQFSSRDGRYNCRDMDIEVTSKEAGIRPVNINTISELIYNGVKYIVKK